MSTETKTCIRFYLLTDYDKEEKWLCDMAKEGWMLKNVRLSKYTFEKTAPQNIVFKLDFQDTKVEPDDEYLQMLEDYGWTYLTSVNNYRYLYKTASDNAAEDEIYTDNASKLEMLKTIIRRKFLPFLLIFIAAVIPGFSRAIGGELSTTSEVIWYILMVLYCVVILKIGIGYNRLYKKYREK